MTVILIINFINQGLSPQTIKDIRNIIIIIELTDTSKWVSKETR